MYVRKCLDHEAPAYLSDMLTSVSDVDVLRRHRSADRADIIILFQEQKQCAMGIAVYGVWSETVELKTPDIN